jgi:predicted GH43/DUF377 family glycosyl hydrolase
LTVDSFDVKVERLGIALASNGDATEVEGVLNPAIARSRDGSLIMYPRCVAAGNVSRIGLAEAAGAQDEPVFERLGFALEPREAYELRAQPGGYGCEDPRVTFIPILDAYFMAYTAFGPNGPRIAFATSRDAYVWERLGLADFSAPGLPCGDDKDAALFPEPVISPSGVLSIAFYHRPMHHFVSVDGRAAAELAVERSPRERECTRIAYVPLAAVLRDRANLLKVAESALVLEAGPAWGHVKNGAGTIPVRTDEGWLSLFHGVDARYTGANAISGLVYQGGIVIHDIERPHIVRYRSPEPILSPETAAECRGAVANVVFPTGIDVRPGAAPRDYDVYYGMADSRIGRARVVLSPASVAEPR